MASITVFVDLAGLPHAFVGLTDDQGNTTYYGYFPNPDTSNGHPVGPGFVGEGIDPKNIKNAGHMDQVSFSKTVNVTAEQLAAAKQTAEEWKANPRAFACAMHAAQNDSFWEMAA